MSLGDHDRQVNRKALDKISKKFDKQRNLSNRDKNREVANPPPLPTTFCAVLRHPSIYPDDAGAHLSKFQVQQNDNLRGRRPDRNKAPQPVPAVGRHGQHCRPAGD